jgi:hypothetical protein
MRDSGGDMIPLCSAKRFYFLRRGLCAFAFGAAFLLFLHRAAAQPSPSAAARNTDGDKLDATNTPGSLIGIQYEHWFYGPDSWKTTEAVPLLGKYTIDESTVSRHYDQFHQLGIDWLLIDWSNMLWSKPAWEQHSGDTKKLEDKTAVLFQTALHLRQRGRYAPKLVFMLGLQNGPPVPNGVERLNGELAWLKKNYLDKPEYRDLWLYDGGKPLITILYWPPDPCAQLPADLAAHALKTQDWTVRWMSTQLQDNHADRCGMWSWMDSVIPQIVTHRDGKAEEIVVTPSSFELPGKGWTAPSAITRDHGVPYLQSWKAAFAARPKFIQIHQWNEFAGQQEDHGLPEKYWSQQETGIAPQPSRIYADEYNVQRSDDIEPTDRTACGLRGCGGWGFYYFNLTRAIISLYRGKTPDITVLALSGPNTPVVMGTRTLTLHWEFLGEAPSSYSLLIDGRVENTFIQGSTYSLDISRLKPGRHIVLLKAAGVHTYFSLDPAMSAVLSRERLPVESEISFDLDVQSKAP